MERYPAKLTAVHTRDNANTEFRITVRLKSNFIRNVYIIILSPSNSTTIVINREYPFILERVTLREHLNKNPIDLSFASSETLLICPILSSKETALLHN
jgi:hypothetical protein